MHTEGAEAFFPPRVTTTAADLSVRFARANGPNRIARANRPNRIARASKPKLDRPETDVPYVFLAQIDVSDL